jgi:2',3'-cyclic-nucleotide 2'-phosphodiesterase
VELRVLVIGDVVGSPGRYALASALPGLIKEREIDFVIANGENAARGSGITEKLFWEIATAGVNAVTLGDHVWRRKEVIPLLQSRRNILRPANLPDICPGFGSAVLQSRSGVPIGIVTVVGRVFMDPCDCPFRAVDRELARLRQETKVLFVEIHAEASSEKIAFGWKFAGKASCVFGTHTHVQTADERVLPGGTAYITDLGMTGPYESVIGRDIQSVLFRFETLMHAPFVVATGDVRLAGALVTVESDSGQARGIERIMIPVAMRDGLTHGADV